MTIANRWPVATFFLLACAISWPLALLGSMENANRLIGTTATYAAKFGPSLAGLVMIALLSGRSGLRDAFSSLTNWRVGKRWWIIALLLPGVLWSTTISIHMLGNGVSLDWTAVGPWIFAALVLKHTLLGGGLGEEIGWRGFMLQHMQSTRTAFSSALTVGVLWGMWHAPKLWVEGGVTSLVLFTLYTIALSVVFTAVYNSAGGSLFVVTLLHGATNATNGYVATLIPNLSTAFENYVIVLGLCWLGLAVALSALLGPRRLAPRATTVSVRDDRPHEKSLQPQEG